MLYNEYMKKIVTSFVLFILSFFLFSVTSVSARILTSQNGNITVAKGEIINDDLFIGAQGATIDGIVNGDVFIGAQMVRIGGTVNGNLHIGAQTVDITGAVKGNVYVGAQNIILTGSTIGGSFLAGSQNLNLDKASVVGGSLIVGGATVNVDSQVKRSVYAGSGMLTIGADAKIGKNLYYAVGSNTTATIDKNAKIAGEIFKSQTNVPQKNVQLPKQAPKIFGAAVILMEVISFVGALFVGLLYLNLFGRNFRETAGIVSKHFWKSFGVGFLITIAFIPGLFVMLITVIGIPIAGLAILWLLFYSYLAKIVVGASLGSTIAGKTSKMPEFLAFAIGLFIIYLLKLIPIVGFLTTITVVWVGLGALTLQLFSKTE